MKTNSFRRNFNLLIRCLKFCTPFDYLLILGGLLGSVLTGLFLPAFAFLYKEFLNSLNPRNSGEELQSKFKFYLRENKRNRILFFLNRSFRNVWIHAPLLLLGYV